MKKVYLSSILLGVFFLAVTSMKNTTYEMPLKQPVLTDTLIPYLPEVPYDYDIEFPDHVFNSWGFKEADAVEINNQITPEGATLGRVLFYDKKLSVTNEISCGSCHKQANSFADDQQFSEGVNGFVTTRNVPNLNDKNWLNSGNSTGAFFWDCRESVLEDLALQPIVHEGEMGKDLEVLIAKLAATEYYPPLFESAFGSPEITPERIGIAIAQFIRSMTTFNSKYDELKAGPGFTSTLLSGLMTFQAFCENCHQMQNFGMENPFNNGLDTIQVDIGLAAVTGDSLHIGVFRSPSLRNIALTAPYMHDGRFKTLDEVLEFYNSGIQPTFGGYYIGPNFDGFHLTPQKTLDLKRFLESLTDETFLTDVRYSNPFENPLADKETERGEQMRIYPNPFSGTTWVDLGSVAVDPITLRLTSAQGHVLKTFMSNGGTFLLEMQGFPPGIYFLEIQKGSHKVIEKLVYQGKE